MMKLTRRFMITACSMAIGALTLGIMQNSAFAQDKPLIKIGFMGPLSGGNAQQGMGARNGFRLAIAKANADKDYPFHVEGVELDDGGEPQMGVSAAMKLVNDPDVVAATGHWNSSVALATSPVFARFQIPLVVWGAIGPSITEQGIEQVTRVTPTLLTENKPLAEWTIKRLNAKKIAIIADTTDYGKSNSESFGQFIKDAGGTVTSVDLLPVGTIDFRAVLTKMRGQKLDAIYFGGVITEAGIVRRQMSELGLNLPMLGISGIYDPEYIKVAGKAAEGTLVSYPAAQTNQILAQMDKDYAAQNYAEPSNPYTKYAYDSTNVILQAVKEVGTGDKAALTTAIRNIKLDGATGIITFDAKGQTQVPIAVEIFTVKDGKWVPYIQ